ncbi:odorant receptor 24a-like [Episyrphus balteatus]|uniref:odorant receptor 24a-like n=1 Tax=Episyrphus balteatus TaxID=286459 RepID=UPI002486100A|nr:odorant receptor 24a-like [Episyrphus balteatus]
MSLKFLTKDYPITNSYFIISKFCLGWMGQYPQAHSSTLRNLNCLFHVLVLFLGVISQFWYGFHYLKVDLVRGIDAICPAISCLVSFVKMALIICNGKELSRVLIHLKLVLFSELDEEKTKIVQKFSLTATKLAFMVLISGILANVVYSLRPLVTNVFRISMGMEYLFDETPLKVMVPSVLLTLPWYPLTYALISYMAQVCIIAFSGVDGVFISFCLYSAALLKILQRDMRLTFEKYHTSTLTLLDDEDNRKCFDEVGRIVRRHNEIIDLVRRFSQLFMWITLAHFVTSSIVIGASIIEALLYPGFRALVCISYTLAVSCELFIFCYGGSAVIENSFDLGMSAYFTNWYHCDKRVQKAILIIIARSQKPLTMDVPFFTPSLVTFTSILQTAGSIIAVVKSVL